MVLAFDIGLEVKGTQLRQKPTITTPSQSWIGGAKAVKTRLSDHAVIGEKIMVHLERKLDGAWARPSRIQNSLGQDLV